MAFAIARSKLYEVQPWAVLQRCSRLLESDATDVPEGEFWSLAYHSSTLRQICRLREALRADCKSPTDIVLRALVMGILHGPLNKGKPSYLSNQMPRTYATKPAGAIRYWCKRSMYPPEVDVLEVVRSRAEYTLAGQPKAGEGKVILGDSLDVELDQGHGPFDHVITSPPYFGMYTYYPDQWLRAWFLGGSTVPTGRGSVQLGHGSRMEFTENLARVWRRVAAVCRPGAKLRVRFGSLPSAAVDPGKLITDSLKLADAGWRVGRVISAGDSRRGRRQADQFLEADSYTINEVDLDARLVE